MVNQLKQRKQAGFTIIEVMIVLAIAAMILLVVLLAVPALQRNSRNTALKNDAAAVTGAVSEFVSNNDGTVPTAASTCAAGSFVASSGTTSTTSTAKVQGGTVVDCSTSLNAVTPTAGTLYVRFGGKCPATLAQNATSVTPVSSPRGTAVIYSNETSGGTQQAKCTDS